MAISYNKLWKLLIDRKMKRTDLISGAKISSSALSKMGKDEPVSLEIIEKVCQYLKCDIEQILEIKYNDRSPSCSKIKVTCLFFFFFY